MEMDIDCLETQYIVKMLIHSKILENISMVSGDVAQSSSGRLLDISV